MSTLIQIASSGGGGAGDITIGTTPIISGTAGRILFQGTGNVAQQDSALFWDNTNKRLGIGANANTPSSVLYIRSSDPSAHTVLDVRNGAYGDQLFKIIDNATASQTSTASIIVAGRIYSHFSTNQTNSGGQLDLGGYGLGSTYGDSSSNSVWLNNQGNIGDGIGTSVISVSSNLYLNLQTTKKIKFEGVTGNFGIGQVGTLGARLDIKAQGALSTDLAFRIRNSDDTDNLIQGAGDGLWKFKTGGERIEINTTSSDYKISAFKYDVEMTKISTYSSYFCYGGSDQFLGIGNNSPSHLLDVNKIGTQKYIAARFGNDYNSTIQSDVVLKFTTAYCGGGFGGNPLAYLTVGNNNTGATENARTYFKFELLKDNTLAEKASITSQSNLLLQTPTEDTNDVGVIYIPNGTAPTASITNGIKIYSDDITAGNAAPHFLTEAGDLIKLYKQSSAGILTVGDIVTVLTNLGLLA